LTRVENPEAGAHGTGGQSRTAEHGPHTTTAPQDGTDRTRQGERLGRTHVLSRTSLPVRLTDQPHAVFHHRGEHGLGERRAHGGTAGRGTLFQWCGHQTNTP